MSCSKVYFTDFRSYHEEALTHKLQRLDDGKARDKRHHQRGYAQRDAIADFAQVAHQRHVGLIVFRAHLISPSVSLFAEEMLPSLGEKHPYPVF